MTPRQHGFTLLEMIVAITVSAIVVGFMSLFLTAPMDAYIAQERRTELADSANSARRMLENDIRSALPESVRIANVGGESALELLYAADVARYRPAGSSGIAIQDLSVGAPDSQFYTLGAFTGALATPGVHNGYLVVAHSVGGDAYALSGVISALTTITTGLAAGGEQPVTLGAAATFPVNSPTRSVFFVTGAVSYVCNPAAGTLKRFSNYGISANQLTHATEAQLGALGAASSLVAQDLTACTFNYTLGTPYYGGLARLQITFARNGETVQVLDQVQVEQRP
jgi:MSHA biogenesis protein MshO